jgi:enamine deaminase RidA (YjgF/YER057c/UK114 family)
LLPISASVRMYSMIERKPIEPAAWGTDLEWYHETRLSPAVQVGDLLFVAGCTGSSAIAEGPRAQMRRAYEEVGEVLHAAGASWDDVVSMTSYAVDFRHIDAMTEIHREIVTKEPFPAWTAVGVTELYGPKDIVEVSVIALVPQDEATIHVAGLRDAAQESTNR